MTERMTKWTTIEELAAWVRRHDDFVLIGHVSPDGDATGSCMAVSMALQSIGKRSFVCLPGGVSYLYKRYPQADSILSEQDEIPFVPKTAFALDVSDPARLGAFRDLYDGCGAQAVLDHHDTNPGFGDLCVVDGGRAAAGELALELIEAIDAPLTEDIATWLFVAISTDSGQFGFSSTTPKTMAAGGRLIEAGVDVGRLTRELWHTRSRARTKLMGMVLAELKVSADGKMAWSRLTQDMLKSSDATWEDNEGIVNYLLEIEGVELAVLAEERDAGIKFSLRSKEWMDVAADIAAVFGGGGHNRAAGCTLKLPMDEAIAQVLALGEKIIQNHDEME